jgi:hypothetical protein
LQGGQPCGYRSEAERGFDDGAVGSFTLLVRRSDQQAPALRPASRGGRAWRLCADSRAGCYPAITSVHGAEREASEGTTAPWRTTRRPRLRPHDVAGNAELPAVDRRAASPVLLVGSFALEVPRGSVGGPTPRSRAARVGADAGTPVGAEGGGYVPLAAFSWRRRRQPDQSSGRLVKRAPQPSHSARSAQPVTRSRAATSRGAGAVAAPCAPDRRGYGRALAGARALEAAEPRRRATVGLR